MVGMEVRVMVRVMVGMEVGVKMRLKAGVTVGVKVGAGVGVEVEEDQIQIMNQLEGRHSWAIQAKKASNHREKSHHVEVRKIDLRRRRRKSQSQKLQKSDKQHAQQARKPVQVVVLEEMIALVAMMKAVNNHRVVKNPRVVKSQGKARNHQQRHQARIQMTKTQTRKYNAMVATRRGKAQGART